MIFFIGFLNDIVLPVDRYVNGHRLGFQSRGISPARMRTWGRNVLPWGLRERPSHTFIMFSFSTNILWHFLKNGQTKCKSMVHPKGLWNPMLNAREILKIDSPNENSLRKFEDDCSVFPISCQYVNTKASTQKKNVNTNVFDYIQDEIYQLYTRRNSPKHESIECHSGCTTTKGRQ